MCCSCILSFINVTAMFSCYSPWSSWSRKVWQILWYVVFGCHHVYSVSGSAPYPVFQTFPLIFIWGPMNQLVRNHIVRLNSFAFLIFPGSVATHLFIPITAWPYHLGWRGGSAWDSTSFPIPNGLKSQKKVCTLMLISGCCCGRCLNALPVYIFFLFKFVQMCFFFFFANCMWGFFIAKQLIKRLLKTEPSMRMTISEFMYHPWINVRTKNKKIVLWNA